MFESSPIIVSPIYDRWFAFDFFPITVFFVSTKFPTFAPSFNSVSGLILANGPMLHFDPMLAPSTLE